MSLRNLDTSCAYPATVLHPDGSRTSLVIAATATGPKGERVFLSADGRAYLPSLQSHQLLVRAEEYDLDPTPHQLSDKPRPVSYEAGDGFYPANLIDPEAGGTVGIVRIRSLGTREGDEPWRYQDEAGQVYEATLDGKGVIRVLPPE